MALALEDEYDFVGQRQGKGTLGRETEKAQVKVSYLGHLEKNKYSQITRR